jgi:hypothetical protein
MGGWQLGSHTVVVHSCDLESSCCLDRPHYSRCICGRRIVEARPSYRPKSMKPWQEVFQLSSTTFKSQDCL